ncbi:MAG: chromosomal replication initiator protein DnaA [Holosporaceae bacterium]|jgi:chromosomal replication initiator protein|nr:chromosomal replication initiator protein DnaA [Rhodospirillaceae bacterium]
MVKSASAETGSNNGGSPESEAVSPEAVWQKVRNCLMQELGESVFEHWLDPLQFVGFQHDVLQLAAPSRFVADWVNGNYIDRIRAYWTAMTQDSCQISIADSYSDGYHHAGGVNKTDAALTTARTAAAAPSNESAGGYGGAKMPAGRVAVESDRSSFQHGLDPRFTFENFVVGKPNELAFAAARRVAESPTVAFNPLFLYGGVGLGKTHLMHAIAWHLLRTAPERKVIYLSAERFMYEFVRALRFKDTMAFKEQFRNVDVLMIDDVQFISGKESTQEEFFHTFNTLVDQNHQVIVSADKSPADLEGMEDRLKSRLGWGLVADIHPTSYELRLSILMTKVESQSVPVPTKVLEFLAHKITSNVRELEGALNRLIAHASLIGGTITLESAQEVLRDLLKSYDKYLSIEDIQKKVAEHFNIKLADMHSPRRARALARPRQVAMYLSKQLTSRSLPEIGRKFGGRDHTTVMHGVKKIEELLQSDPGLEEEIDLLTRALRS